ncbi:MAG: carbohydrate ABC transporter permease [Arachnia sp.]
MTTATSTHSRVRHRRKQRRKWEPYLLLAPAIILILIFAGYPFVRSVWMAFTEVSPFTGAMDFTGLENFRAILSDPHFASYLAQTAFWVVGAVGLQLICGLILALLVNTRFPLRGIYRGLMMVPWATPSVLVALMWKWLLDPNNGIINKLLLGVGIIDQPVAFLSNGATALPTLIVVDVWQGIPLFAVMILAALQAVSGDLKEAAATDGCGPVGVFRHVVLPAILPTILITALLRIIWTANYVDLIFILTGGGPGISSTTIALQSYLTAYKSTDFGQGAAYSVLQAAILVIFVVMYLRLSKKAEEQR